MITTAKELVAACLDAAENYKTLYVMGGFGAPMTEKNKTRYINGYAFNAKAGRKEKILAASDDTFGFDCVCFIKGLFWGWNGDASQIYGGATYKSNGVPDIGADQMIRVCVDVTEDFSTIIPGELVWLPGHVGIYIGNGKAVEATFEPDEGVQIQAVLPMGEIPGMAATGWQKHGKLPWVTYDEVVNSNTYRVTVEGLSKVQADNLAATYANTGLTVTVEPMSEQEPQKPVEWVPKEGDVVFFGGGTQYGNANAKNGKAAAAGEARIHKIADGKNHPYSLVRTGKTGPYGWVDAGTFTKT